MTKHENMLIDKESQSINHYFDVKLSKNIIIKRDKK